MLDDAASAAVRSLEVADDIRSHQASLSLPEPYVDQWNVSE